MRAMMVRRMKNELLGWDGKPLFPPRELRTLEVEYSEEERQAHRWLQEYTQLRRRHVAAEQWAAAV